MSRQILVFKVSLSFQRQVSYKPLFSKYKKPSESLAEFQHISLYYGDLLKNYKRFIKARSLQISKEMVHFNEKYLRFLPYFFTIKRRD